MGLLKKNLGVAHQKLKAIREIVNAVVRRLAENYDKELKNCLL